MPSMKTARNVDGRANFCVSECDDTKRAAPYQFGSRPFLRLITEDELLLFYCVEDCASEAEVVRVGRVDVVIHQCKCLEVIRNLEYDVLLDCGV